MDWLERVACKGYHPDFWFPPLDAPDPNEYYNIGKAVCNICPVWEYCAELGKDEKYGLWGGTTPQERRNPAKVPHGTRERFRLNCSCDSCFDAAAVEVVKIDLRKVPKSGQQYTIDNISST